MPRPRFARHQAEKVTEHDDDHGVRFMIAISDTPPTVAVGEVSQTAMGVALLEGLCCGVILCDGGGLFLVVFVLIKT
jgi:hypothetical protein